MQGETQQTQADSGARRYKLLRTLGKGSFSKVKEAVHIISGELVAIKVLDKAMIAKEEDLNRIKREIKILKVANHPNLISLYEIMETDKYYFFVMEHAPGGELSKYICDRGKLDEKTACKLFRQLMKGVEYLSQMGCAHRDIKPSNILLKNDKDLKLIDFGLGNFYSKGELLLTPCGSPCYAAPELVTGQTYNGMSVDIWSSGITLFAMLCGHLPFNDDSRKELFRKIAACDYKMPEYLSSSAKDLIKKIFVANPKKRISLTDIKEHPWYNIAKDDDLATSNGDSFAEEAIKESDIIALSAFYMKIATEKLKVMVQETQANKYTCCYKLFLEKRRQKRLTKEDLSNIAALRMQEASTDSSLNKPDGCLSPTFDPTRSPHRSPNRQTRSIEQHRNTQGGAEITVNQQVRLPSIRQEPSINTSTYRGDSTEPPSNKTSKGSGLKRYFIDKLRDMNNSRENSRNSSASRTEENPAPIEERIQKKVTSSRYRVETLTKPAEVISGYNSRDSSPPGPFPSYPGQELRNQFMSRDAAPQPGSDFSKAEEGANAGNKSRQMLRVVSHKQYNPTALTASVSKQSQVVRTPNMKISLLSQGGQSRLFLIVDTQVQQPSRSVSPDSRPVGAKPPSRLRIDTGREDSIDTSFKVVPPVVVTQSSKISPDAKISKPQSKRSSKQLSVSAYQPQPTKSLRVTSPTRGVQLAGQTSAERRDSRSQDDPKQLANIKTMIKQILKDSGSSSTERRSTSTSQAQPAEKFFGPVPKPAELAAAASYKPAETISKPTLQLRSMISPKAGTLRNPPGTTGGFFNQQQKK